RRGARPAAPDGPGLDDRLAAERADGELHDKQHEEDEEQDLRDGGGKSCQRREAQGPTKHLTVSTNERGAASLQRPFQRWLDTSVPRRPAWRRCADGRTGPGRSRPSPSRAGRAWLSGRWAPAAP